MTLEAANALTVLFAQIPPALLNAQKTGWCIPKTECYEYLLHILNKRSEAEGQEPIAEFVEWILRAWDKKYKTYIWVSLLT